MRIFAVQLAFLCGVALIGANPVDNDVLYQPLSETFDCDIYPWLC